MIIYEFSTWGAWESDNGLFSVEEVEVEEKPKSYVGKGHRINKSDIGVVTNHYGNRMFSLDNNPNPYIEAMIERNRNIVQSLEKSLEIAKKELKAWETLQRKVGENET